eukprot:5963084-Prymnesium_polylepis.1
MATAATIATTVARSRGTAFPLPSHPHRWFSFASPPSLSPRGFASGAAVESRRQLPRADGGDATLRGAQGDAPQQGARHLTTASHPSLRPF